MKNLLNYLKLHLPYIVGLVLIVVNALVDNNVLNIPDRPAAVINAILAALGLGILHHRQVNK